MSLGEGPFLDACSECPIFSHISPFLPLCSFIKKCPESIHVSESCEIGRACDPGWTTERRWLPFASPWWLLPFSFPCWRSVRDGIKRSRNVLRMGGRHYRVRVFAIAVSSLWSSLLLHQRLLPSWPISGCRREEQTHINAPRGFVVTTDQSIFFESQTFSIFSHENIARKHCHSQLMSADKYR